MDEASARSPLVAWVDAPRGDRTIRVATDDGWTTYPYEELAARVRAGAAQIAGAPAEGAGRPVVAIVVRSGVDFIAAFFGALLAGRTPCPIVPPTAFQDFGEYGRHLVRLLSVARPGLVVADADLVAHVVPAAREAGLQLPPLVLSHGTADDEHRFVDAPPAELALLQFTSGSSGTPKGARVTWGNLEAGLTLTADSLQVDTDSHYASWLPLYHDMGLIGVLLLSLTCQCNLSLMRPDQFVRDPLRYVACFGRDGATNAVQPTFGFGYIARRVRPEDLEGMDFSAWRSAGVGAERVGAGALHRFTRLLEPYGFKPTTFGPGYGMAEAVLQVTGTPGDAVPWAVRMDHTTLRFGERVDLERRGLMEAGAGDDAAEWLVSSGQPLGDFDLRIAGEDGSALPEGHLGEVVVRGAAVTDGYLGDSGGGLTRFEEGALHTGDAGLLLDGDLFVVGRMGDAISVRGRSIYLEDVEAKLEEIPGIPAGRCVMLAGAERVVALVEAEPGDWLGPARAAIVRHCGTEVAVEIRSAARGTIRRTSSGKPRRRQMWQALLSDELGGVTVA